MYGHPSLPTHAQRPRMNGAPVKGYSVPLYDPLP
ncbi:hypothetical protein AciX8_1253 [Granulicella mallensis MP5ACTX8]|uniref:Uncharacterized protein n=1 Tax=Granulicella mallensis (strain ATCC BAA-1857 / DSM 23137 / MP5ACTX8) TaxID=682795 RepID=G8NY09_GRAMM|nr:hypothetical protein AciX8_1253 [Granulicella mallensis MP5ACTX8]